MSIGEKLRNKSVKLKKKKKKIYGHMKVKFKVYVIKM